jgi:hypothetical protein
LEHLRFSSFVIREIDEDLSRKGAKAQSAAAFPTVFFAPLRGKFFLSPVDSNQDLFKGY